MNKRRKGESNKKFNKLCSDMIVLIFDFLEIKDQFHFSLVNKWLFNCSLYSDFYTLSNIHKLHKKLKVKKTIILTELKYIICVECTIQSVERVCEYKKNYECNLNKFQIQKCFKIGSNILGFDITKDMEYEVVVHGFNYLSNNQKGILYNYSILEIGQDLSDYETYIRLYMKIVKLGNKNFIYKEIDKRLENLKCINIGMVVFTSQTV